MVICPVMSRTLQLTSQAKHKNFIRQEHLQGDLEAILQCDQSFTEATSLNFTAALEQPLYFGLNK